MSKKERAKLNDLNKTLYSNKMDMSDLETWRNIGFLEELQWYGASADFMLTFSNYRT